MKKYSYSNVYAYNLVMPIILTFKMEKLEMICEIGTVVAGSSCHSLQHPRTSPTHPCIPAAPQNTLFPYTAEPKHSESVKTRNMVADHVPQMILISLQ